jgi:ribosomal protein L12E/L44/L45/RPP1/RPP2
MSTAVKIRKQFILAQDKIRQVKKIVHAKNDTEAITMALDIIIENSRIESTLKSIKGKGNIKDVYGRTAA